jgi:hypothetical protein
MPVTHSNERKHTANKQPEIHFVLSFLCFFLGGGDKSIVGTGLKLHVEIEILYLALKT